MSDFSDSDCEDDGGFAAAADHVQHTHTAYTQDQLLALYALYKQATAGRCNTPKPGIFNMQGRAKWNAWHELGSMASSEAKSAYVELVKKIAPEWGAAHDSDEKFKGTTGWVVHSVELPPAELEKHEHEKTCFDYVKESNLPKLRDKLNSAALLQLDEQGMGLLHWATDRNLPDIVQFLLESGADVNARDAEKQTPLHYAASCGHVDCLRILLTFSADRFAKDVDGQTCLDVAESPEVLDLLNAN